MQAHGPHWSKKPLRFSSSHKTNNLINTVPVILFFAAFFFWPESCKVHSRADNECKLAESRGTESCEKSPTVASQKWQSGELSRNQNWGPRRLGLTAGCPLATAALTYLAFGGCYPGLHWFIWKLWAGLLAVMIHTHYPMHVHLSFFLRAALVKLSSIGCILWSCCDKMQGTS